MMSRQSRSLWYQTRILGSEIAIYQVESDANARRAAYFYAVNLAYPWLGGFYRCTTEPTLIALTQRLEQWRRRRIGFFILIGLTAVLLLTCL
jgi:hypothetical protein